MLDSWVFYVIIYLITSVIYNQSFKVATAKMKKDGAMMVLLNFCAALFCLLLIPLFEWKLTTDIVVYLLLLLASVFYTINDRLETTVMGGVDASTFTILSQLSTSFMIILGFLILKEPFAWNKVIGSCLIILSNILIFYKKGTFKLNKYVLLGILANLSYTVAMFIDVNNASKLSLPLYVFTTLFIPSILVSIIERVKPSEIKEEYKNVDKRAFVLTVMTYGGFILSSLRAYQLGEVTIVAPLISLTVISNVLVSYFFLKEKNDILKKIIASIVIIIGVILIK